MSSRRISFNGNNQAMDSVLYHSRALVLNSLRAGRIGRDLINISGAKAKKLNKEYND